MLSSAVVGVVAMHLVQLFFVTDLITIMKSTETLHQRLPAQGGMGSVPGVSIPSSL